MSEKKKSVFAALLALVIIVALSVATCNYDGGREAQAQTTVTKARLPIEGVPWGYGTVSVPTSTGGTNTRHKFTPINVLARGVVGDGATDDADSLQAIIDEVGAYGGGAIYLPAGVYKIGSELVIDNSYISMFGDLDTDLSGGTVLRSSAASGMLKIEGAFDPGVHIRHVNIAGILFDGNDIATRGIKVKAAGNVAISGCSVRAINGHDLRMDEVWDSWVEDTYFSQYVASDSAVVYVGNGTTLGTSNSIRFHGCTWESYSSVALDVVGISTQKNSNIYIDRCKFEPTNETVYMSTISFDWAGSVYITNSFISAIRPEDEPGKHPISLSNVFGAYIHGLSLGWRDGEFTNDCVPISTHGLTSNVSVMMLDYSTKTPGRSPIRNFSATADTASFCIVGAHVYDNTDWSIGPWKNVFPGQALVDTVSERVSDHGVRIDGLLLKDSILRTTSARLDTLAMKTALHGVVIDPILPINATAKAADYSISPSDNVVFFSGQTGNVFATLPTMSIAPTGVTVPVGKTYLIINCDVTATDSVFVEAYGTESLNANQTRRAVGLRGYDGTNFHRAKIMYVNLDVGWVRID